MREVAIIGAGSTKFGELWGTSFRDLGIEAGAKALADAGLSGEEIDAVYVGNFASGSFIKQQNLDALVADYTGMATRNVPAVRTEAGGASGGVAFRQGVMAVASGMADRVIVGGAEKMTDLDDDRVGQILNACLDAEWEAGMGVTLTSIYAMIARRLMAEGIATREEIASCAVNSHFHGARNPEAEYRKEIKLDTVLRAGPTCDPLTMFDGAPFSDGASAVILCPLEEAKKITDKYVKVSAVAQASDTLAFFQRDSFTSFAATAAAAQEAYKLAHIEAKDVDVAEVHDVQTVGGVLALQDMGLYAKGEAGKAFLEGQTHFDAGKVAINTSGGLKAKGNPVGATGVSQIAELYMQLTGTAGDRQVKDAKYGAAQSVGGTGSSVTVSILEAI